MTHAFDVSLDLSLSMVIRGARDEAHAREIAQALARTVANANECLRGADYGQPLVAEFSVIELGETIDVDPLDEGEG